MTDEDDRIPSGHWMITAERMRQLYRDGWSLAYDREEHVVGELARAAVCYVEASINIARFLRWATDDGPRWLNGYTGFSKKQRASALADFNRAGQDPLGHQYGRTETSVKPPRGWPWEPADWKPDNDPVRNLVKAGALIAAEIDRLLG